MSRIYFEDLPSTNTPRNATNLNKLNNVIISSTEPNTGEEVWVQKGDNLLDLYDLASETIGGVTFTNNGDGTFTVNGTATETAQYSTNIYLENEQKYFLSGCPANGSSSTYRLRLQDSTYTQSVSDTGSGASFTAHYTKYLLRIIVYSGQTVNLLFKPMLVKGENALPFEKYITKKIYSKNSNDVYEEFYDESEMNKENYSTEEQVIGAWIDGKPLYRKTLPALTVSRNTNQNYNLSDYGITNTEFLVIDNSISCGMYSRVGTVPVNYFLTETDHTMVYVNGARVLNIRNQSSSERTFYITLKYTKTTD